MGQVLGNWKQIKKEKRNSSIKKENYRWLYSKNTCSQ